MFKNLITSFGSKSILEMIKKQHPDRAMVLLANKSDNNNFQLVDFSGESNVFQSPLHYQVISQSGQSVAGNIFTFDFFELSDDTLKAFDTKISQWANQNANSYELQNVLILNPIDSKPNNRAILSIWNAAASNATIEARELKNLIAPYTNQNYFRTTYVTLV
jgi:hypothetical protein